MVSITMLGFRLLFYYLMDLNMCPSTLDKLQKTLGYGHNVKIVRNILSFGALRGCAVGGIRI